MLPIAEPIALCVPFRYRALCGPRVHFTLRSLRENWHTGPQNLRHLRQTKPTIRFFYFWCMKTREQILLGEATVKTSRSGGKGGQNVNKVSTKVELVFDVAASTLFTETEKERLLQKLADKFDGDGLLHVISQASRSQAENKAKALEKLSKMLENALKVPKKRVATKPKKGAVERRLTEKKKTGELKKLRGGKPDF